MENNNKLNKSAIKCSAGKTYLLDPNLLFGQGIDENIYVTPEDLNIYVELTTSRKNRSIIDIKDDGFEAQSTDVGKSRVSFIDGTENGEIGIDGEKKKSLTTSYTELTTVFNKTADTEKFGITSIDIDFNSAYAPLIHIEFVDIRGASLFNTGNPPKSEYASFFDLPYPIFQLKVKGYYGRPVKYCLHLVKWNARFNAKSGNFEISADFIGYTYALLSDMLLGYLRAIVETDAGYAKFLEAKSEMNNEAELITINELLDKIVDVNEAIAKLNNTDSDVQELSKNKEINSAIESLEALLKDGMNGIKEPDSSSPEGYALVDSGDGLIGVRNSPQDLTQTKTNRLDLQNWKDAMRSQIGELNTNISPESQYNVENFVGEKVPLYYENFIYDEIISGNTETNQRQLDFRTAWGLLDEGPYEDFISTRMVSIINQTNTRKQNLTLYDFSKTIKSINNIKIKVGVSEETIKEKVAIKIKQTFIDLIGFEPTIGSIFRIFTVHAEIFLARLKEVSIKAEADVDNLRFEQIKNLKDRFDIHKITTTDSGPLPSKIYAWPLFRKPAKDANKSGALEEAYLGDPNGGVLTPQNVPELVFVEELLDGLIKVARDDAERQERIDNPDTIVDSWFPINVLDTPLFGVLQNPYKTTSIGDSNNPSDPLKLMMMRAFTFLGVSNRFLTPVEIKLMGILEANTCFEGVKNPIVKRAIIDVAESDIETAKKIIGYFKNGSMVQPPSTEGRNISINFGDEKTPLNAPRPLLVDIDENTYAYTYLSQEASSEPKPSGGTKTFRTAISFNDDFDGSGFFKKIDGSNNYQMLDSSELLAKSENKNRDGELSLDGLLFIEPNYRADITGSFEDSGAMYMKIFTETQYDSAKALVPNYENQAETINNAIAEMKNQEGVTEFLDSGTLADVSREDEEGVVGFNIIGDATSKYAFTTVLVVDMTAGEGDSSESAVPVAGPMPLKALFYVNNPFRFGVTSLSNPPIQKGELEGDDAKKKGNGVLSGIDFYNVRYRNTGTRTVQYPEPYGSDHSNFSSPNNPDLGNNRNLFNNNGLYIPHVDFIVTTNPKLFPDHRAYSLFGSQLYFEQRRSSSPKAARAFLFLHTFPWNQLYTDDTTDGPTMASIFDNNERNTISNLFDRKSAFLNVPYLWCAFIGGILWRIDENPIIFEKDVYAGTPDQSGKVPNYLGGSGKFDPIFWGERVDGGDPKSDIKLNTCVINEYIDEYGDINLGYKYFPERQQYLTFWQANGSLNLCINGQYKNIELTLRLLPVQIKKEFKRLFFDFVNSQEWVNIRASYELKPENENIIWDKPNIATVPIYETNGYVTPTVWGTGTSNWKLLWNQASILNYTTSPIVTDPLRWVTEGSGEQTPNDTQAGGIIGIKAEIVEQFKNWVNYEYLQPIRRVGSIDKNNREITLRYNWDMSFRSNEKNHTLVELFKRGVWIANASFKSWTMPPVKSLGVYFEEELKEYADITLYDSVGAVTQEKNRNNFIIGKNALDSYIQAFSGEWKRLLKLNDEKKEEDEFKQQLFNSMDNNTIRLNIYRHCKSVYDKWIAGSNNSIVSSCGSAEIKKVDKAFNALKRKSGSPHRLIDSFRFVNRGFNDLSDTFLLNPTAIGDIMQGNMNQSFYDMISRVLSDNNFNFIALPAYIDFHDITEMEALFKPEIYNNDLANDISGPTFVCVYVGQTSNKLDLGGSSNYPNDGFDFKCDRDSEGNLTGQLVVNGDNGLPDDFTSIKKDHEHNVIAFEVNYGHQNQNIFTDIKLDQQEFSETDESLQITDAIANNGSQSNRTQAGQNLWNVYQVRSYSTQIEAMGNAMIQPMMYFQLNNIPMFHGAYMIINAKHNITPNYMKTTFKGVRTRYVDTPQVDAQTLYMSMLGTLSDVDGFYKPGSVVSNPTGSVGGSSSSVNQSAIDNSNGLYVRSAGGKTYVWNKQNGFAGETLKTFMYDLEKYLQKQHPSKNIKLASNGVTRDLEATTKGGSGRSTSSKHGAGLAIDLVFVGIYDGKELGNPYDMSATGCKKTDVTCYSYWKGNAVVSKDTQVLQSIRTFVDTDTKWKNIIKWGADFNGEYGGGRLKIAGFPNNGECRVGEMHHFEIKDGIMSQYIPDAAKTEITKLGIPIPNKQSDLPALYNYAFNSNTTPNVTDIKEYEGDGVDNEDEIEAIATNGLMGTISDDKVKPLTKEQKIANLGKI